MLQLLVFLAFILNKMIRANRSSNSVNRIQLLPFAYVFAPNEPFITIGMLGSKMVLYRRYDL